MSGGTRCNITQNTDNRGIIEAYGTQGPFLHSALAALSVRDSIELFEAEGVPTKVEETGKVFPVSNQAADVLAALERRLRRSGAALATEEPLTAIARTGEGFLLTSTKRQFGAGAVIITSGGMSYPGAGTTGEGYTWARELGHTIVPPRPALVPITTSAEWVKALQGITIPDVALEVVERSASPGAEPRVLAERRGSLLYTHFGLSGPVALDVSRAVSGHPAPGQLMLRCDYLPEMNEQATIAYFREQSIAAGKKQLVAILPPQLPRRLHEALLQSSGLRADRKAAELTKQERAQLVQLYKATTIPIAGTRGFAKAEVTAGGVLLDEVNSKNMQSRLVPGLYFAGEVLDLDGPIGGYNFQAAWSTGWLAGMSASSLE
jgi:predicted Rossmann fold flavoprotein